MVTSFKMHMTRRKLLVGFFAMTWIFLIWKLFIEKPEELVPSNLNRQGLKTILLWTKFFGAPDYFPSLDNCQKKCIITSDRSKLSQSEAVVFHLRDTDIHDLPKTRYLNQHWVLLHHEAPPHTPNVLKDLDGLINWTITYRMDSDMFLTPVAVPRKTPQKSPKINYLRNKTAEVFWFVSNCKTPSNREGYAEELKKTINVDIIGSCGNSECSPKMSDSCYKSYAKSHKYYLSFENSVCKDYITEKFFNILKYNVIPIVFTGADMKEIAAPNSYISTLDFKSPKELGEFLLKLSSDEERYNSYFQWKDDYEYYIKPYSCQLCEKLYNPGPVKVWNNLNEWFFDSSKCRKWPGGFK